MKKLVCLTLTGLILNNIVLFSSKTVLANEIEKNNEQSLEFDEESADIFFIETYRGVWYSKTFTIYKESAAITVENYDEYPVDLIYRSNTSSSVIIKTIEPNNSETVSEPGTTFDYVLNKHLNSSGLNVKVVGWQY